MSIVRRVPVLGRWLDRAPAGWRLLGASVVVNAISDGTWFYGFSVFFLPISRDLALSRAATSLPFAIKGIIAAVLGPLTGIWIDRAGPAQILRVSAVLAGIGYVLLSLVHGYGVFVGAIALITVGMLGFVPSTMTAVTRWARRRRSLAVSVAHMGFTMGAAVIPPLLAFGVATAGWRMTVLLVGLGLWGIVMPMSRHLGGVSAAMGVGSEHVTQRLISSLDPESDRDAEQVWLQEAERRRDELESGKVAGIPAEQVLEKARSTLR